MTNQIVLKSTLNKQKKYKNIAIEIIIIALVLLFLSPFYMMFFVSVKSASEALLSPSTIPTEFHFSNYAEAWGIMNYPKAFLNSLLITVPSVLGTITFAGMAGVVIVKSKSKLFNSLYFLFVCGIMVPFYTSLVPIIQIVSNLGITNTYLGPIFVYWGRTLPMAVFLYVGFIKGIPNELVESASIDGANLWTTYWKILFPMLKPITATSIIVNTLWIWNDFLLPSLLISKEALRTIPLSQYAFYGEYGTQWQLAFAAYVLSMIPVLVIYMFLQKHIIKGIAAGAVKG